MQTPFPAPSSLRAWAWGAALVGVTLPIVGFCWGFSVDDAWIISRVVRHGLSGRGFSFNPHQPTDAVTPLGFAQLTAVVSLSLGLEPLLAARLLGLLGWVVAVSLAARRTLREVRTDRNRALAVLVWAVALGTCLPIGAWAGAGLATGLATAWFSAGYLLVFPPRDGDPGAARATWGSLALGAAAGLRPELVLAGGAAVVLSASEHRARWGRGHPYAMVAAFLAAPLLAAVFRWVSFGNAIPLSAVAKAPSFAHGLRYLLGGAALVGPLWFLWLATLGARGRLRRAWPLAAHALGVLGAGGDWMPLFRLWVPIVPAVLALTVPLILARRRRLWWVAPALGANLLLLAAFGSEAREVVSRREALISEARPRLRGARVVAAVDIGWVGAATDAQIVDLAGVTDPRIARLPGGHTSKQVVPGLFSDRDVDTWIVRLSDEAYFPGQSLAALHPSYAVDARLLRKHGDLGFKPAFVLRLEGMGQYVVLLHDP